MSTWQEILDDVREGIKDLTSLEVITLTGDVKSKIDDDGKIKWGDLVNEAKNPAGTVELVAATHVKIDSDTVQFVTDTPHGNLEQLLQVHDAAVESAQINRQAVIELVKGIVKI